MKFIRFAESMLISSIKQKNVSATGSESQGRGEGRGQEGKPVSLIKCTEFRLNYFRACLDGFGDALRGTIALLVSSVRALAHTEHGSTSRSLEFSMKREYVWNVAFFFLCALSLVNAGEEMTIADQMYRVSLMRLWQHLTNFLSFEKANNLNTPSFSIRTT